jgi:hypothetical protein
MGQTAISRHAGLQRPRRGGHVASLPLGSPRGRGGLFRQRPGGRIPQQGQGPDPQQAQALPVISPPPWPVASGSSAASQTSRPPLAKTLFLMKA